MVKKTQDRTELKEENIIEEKDIFNTEELFEKLLVSAEESNKIYRSWIVDLEENSRVTREVLKGEPDPVKYREVYTLWIKSYGKIFDELLALPLRLNINEIFENLTGTPDFYSDTLVQVSKQWKDSFDIKSEKPSKEIFESFVQSANFNLNLSKSWIATLEKLSLKARELSKQTADTGTKKEYYYLWAKMYDKAIDNFSENTPTVSPFKEILEPVKNAAKIYADTFTGISNLWVKSYPASVV